MSLGKINCLYMGQGLKLFLKCYNKFQACYIANGLLSGQCCHLMPIVQLSDKPV